MAFKLRKCKLSGIEWKQFNSLDKCRCELCAKSVKRTKKSIRRVSIKQSELNKIYSELRLEFLSRPENQICFIDGCNKEANTIEHRAGRCGKNFLDITTWAGCCLEHNLELENNSELSKKYQLSKIHGGKKL